jgi:probable F420-dependent oxidoreductase
MKIDGPFYAQLGDAVAETRRLEDIGYDGVYTLEGNSDPFLPLVLVAEHSKKLDIATGIAVALPRNPAHLAYQAWDLHKYSQGRFMLGLGSQVKAHIEKRFGCDFDRPAARMREHIGAIKAFFDCWQDGKPLNFEGEFRRHTLMTPMFNAGPNPYGKPPILLGALGAVMTEVAGEVADGLIVHPFNNEPFIRDHALPAVKRGMQKAGRAENEFAISVTAMIITGATEEEYKAAEAAVRSLLAFYGSTPAYKPPMDAIGYGDLQPVLNKLSKEGKWDDMAALIDDRFVAAFATCGEPSQIAAKLLAKYGDVATRLGIYAPYQSAPDVWPAIIRDLKSA